MLRLTLSRNTALAAPALVISLLGCSSPAQVSPPSEPPGSSQVSPEPAAGQPGDHRSDDAPPVPIPQPRANLDFPAVPDFEFPEAKNGIHSVREMRVRSSKFLGQDVQVEGYVTWIYDCVVENMRPGQTRRQVEKRIKGDPTLCMIPHFYLGDAADTKPERSVWVVEVPRPLRRDEKRRMTREEIAAHPPVPRIALGDRVVVKGRWGKRSPRGFHNSAGLLVYEALRPAKP